MGGVVLWIESLVEGQHRRAGCTFIFTAGRVARASYCAVVRTTWIWGGGGGGCMSTKGEGPVVDETERAGCLDAFACI